MIELEVITKEAMERADKQISLLKGIDQSVKELKELGIELEITLK
jgi:hypothetical protein